MGKVNNIWLIRMDKIGDLVLTLPVDEFILPTPKQPGPSADCLWIINKQNSFIFDHRDGNRNAFPIENFTYSKLNFTQRVSKFLSVWSQLRNKKSENPPQIAVVFHAPWWISLILFLLRIPIRIGRYSQWHSWLFFNKGLRQKRSLSEKSEFEYSKELLYLAKSEIRLKEENANSAKTNSDFNTFTPFLSFYIPKDDQSLKLFEKFGVTEKKYYLLHPGMAGSARNWPSEHYKSLVKKLIKTHIVVITGTSQDTHYLKSLEELATEQNVRWTVGKLSPFELLTLLKFSLGVIAPSTGVAHLAAAVNENVIAIYPPVLSQSKTRWGARGKGVTCLSPNVQCPASTRCLETKCPLFDCMNSVTVDEVNVKLNAKQVPQDYECQ